MADDAPPGEWPLERYREYLHLLARLRLGAGPRGPQSASDVVQQTLLKAHAHREQFGGQTEAEWRAYLRRILANNIADVGRARAREPAVQQGLDQSSARLEEWLAAEQSSPSQQAQHGEMLLRLAEALAQMPEDERTAVELRFLQQPPWPLAEIAKHLGRPSPKAVSGLLERGLKRLRGLMGVEAGGE
jgi:RNA polymerase sigma-70 factor (ECF subfamily)